MENNSNSSIAGVNIKRNRYMPKTKMRSEPSISTAPSDQSMLMFNVPTPKTIRKRPSIRSDSTGGSLVMFNATTADLMDLRKIDQIPQDLSNKNLVGVINSTFMRTCKLHNIVKDKSDVDVDLCIKNLDHIAKVLEIVGSIRRARNEKIKMQPISHSIITQFSESDSSMWDDEADLDTIRDEGVRNWLRTTFYEPDFHYALRPTLKPSQSNFSPMFDRSLLFQRTSILTPEMLNYLSTADDWNFEVFGFAEIAGDKTLQLLAYYFFNRHGLLNKFRIDPITFLRFFRNIEMGYLSYDNLYHNNFHAAEVLQTCHFFFSQINIHNYFSDLEVFAMLFSCAIHDFQHDGFSEKFHGVARTDLSILYNDKSLHCNHSLSKAFRIALQKPGCNIFSKIPLEQYKKLRREIIECTFGFDLVLYEKNSRTLRNMTKTFDMTSKFRIPFLKHLCHICDIAHCAKVWSIHSRNSACDLDALFYEKDEMKIKGFNFKSVPSRKLESIVEFYSIFFRVHVVDAFRLLDSCIDRIHRNDVKELFSAESLSLSSSSCSSEENLSGKARRSTRPKGLNVAGDPKDKFSKVSHPWNNYIEENTLKWKNGGIYSNRSMAKVLESP